MTKVIDSQKAWAKRVGYYVLFNQRRLPSCAYRAPLPGALEALERAPTAARSTKMQGRRQPAPPFRAGIRRSGAPSRPGEDGPDANGFCSSSTGSACGWARRSPGCILILTFAVSYEVFVRYVLRAPTTWAFDVSYIIYGALFLMAGAYTLSRNGHVRADVIYRLWPPRTQARSTSCSTSCSSFPACSPLIYSGWIFAHDVLARSARSASTARPAPDLSSSSR